MKRIFSDSTLFHSTLRIGKNRKPIAITKLRTMKRNAHQKYDETFKGHGNSHMLAKLENQDERVTKIGKFLRKTNLDELPQIINYLKKELVLIGIRPLTRQDYRQLPEDIKQIYNEIGPGLAGIQYACQQFPPRQHQVYEEYRKYYKLWKKSPARANIKYIWKIVANRLRGKGWSR